MSKNQSIIEAELQKYNSLKIKDKDQFPNNMILKNLPQNNQGKKLGRIDIVIQDGIKMVLKRLQITRVKDNKHIYQNVKNQIEACMKFKNSPNPFIIDVIDVWVSPKYYNILTKWCNSHTLQDQLKTDAIANQRPQLCVIYMLSILYSLTACHKQRILMHRDIKPSNIFITHNLMEKQLKLGDFGVSTSENLSKNSQGSDFYEAPQSFGIKNSWLPYQFVKKGGYLPNCDMWSLGVIVYQLYSGFHQYYESLSFPFVQAKQQQEQYQTQTSHDEKVKNYYLNCLKVQQGIQKNPLILKIYKNLTIINEKRMQVIRQLIKEMLWPNPLSRITKSGLYNLIKSKSKILFADIQNNYVIRKFQQYYQQQLKLKENQSCNLPSTVSF